MHTLKVLVVDDYQDRHNKLVKGLKDKAGFNCEFRHRYSPEQVSDGDLRWARIISLDHDMCLQGFSDTGLLVVPDGKCPNPVEAGDNGVNKHCGCLTGMDLVHRIIEAKTWLTAGFLIHTDNQSRGPLMYKTIKDAGLCVARAPAARWPTYNADRWTERIGVALGWRKDAPFE